MRACLVLPLALVAACSGSRSGDPAGSGAGPRTPADVGPTRDATAGADAALDAGGPVDAAVAPDTGTSLDASASPDVGSGPSCQGRLHFPDPSLEAVIREVAMRPAGDLSAADVAAVQHIDAGDRGISDLSGIECLPGLTSLHVYDNDIADITPIETLTGLRFVDLDDNRITDLGPVSGLTALERLTAHGNQITDLAPLVANSGLGTGDYVELIGNPLDCTAQRANIDALTSRGVSLHTDCP